MSSIRLIGVVAVAALSAAAAYLWFQKSQEKKDKKPESQNDKKESPDSENNEKPTKLEGESYKVEISQDKNADKVINETTAVDTDRKTPEVEVKKLEFDLTKNSYKDALLSNLRTNSGYGAAGDMAESMTSSHFEMLSNPTSMEESYVEVADNKVEAGNEAKNVEASNKIDDEDNIDIEMKSNESETSTNKSSLDKEDIEVIELGDEEDGANDKEDADDSVMIIGETNRRITRNSLKDENKQEDEDVVLLKEVKVDDTNSKETADDNSGDDSSVANVETEVTVGDDRTGDAQTDKLNDSIKIDLRPSWQVRKDSVKSQDSTVSI